MDLPGPRVVQCSIDPRIKRHVWNRGNVLTAPRRHKVVVEGSLLGSQRLSQRKIRPSSALIILGLSDDRSMHCVQTVLRRRVEALLPRTFEQSRQYNVPDQDHVKDSAQDPIFSCHMHVLEHGMYAFVNQLQLINECMGVQPRTPKMQAAPRGASSTQ